MYSQVTHTNTQKNMQFRHKYDLLSSIYEYAGQSYISEEIINRHRRFVTQSICSHNLLVQYFASVLA